MRIFTWFYVKDMIYYLILTILPLFLGVFIAFTIPVTTFFRLMVSSILSFLIGVSVSFLLSSLYVRTRYAVVCVLIVLGLFTVSGVTYENFPPLSFYFTKNLSLLGVSIAIFVVFSVFGAFPVMLLWNVLMPYLFELPLIDFSKSLAVVVLCWLLFIGLKTIEVHKK